MQADQDDIDWTGLEEAFGPREGLPDLIKELASPDEKTRSAAYEEAYTASLYHQGTLYPQTVAAVPFILKIAQSRNRNIAKDALVMLRVLAEASLGESSISGPNTRRALLVGLDDLVELLDSSEAITRRFVVHLLSCFPAQRERLLKPIRVHLDNDPDSITRAVALYAIGKIAGPEHTELWRRALDDEAPIVRFVAVFSEASFDAKTEPSKANEVLWDFVQNAGPEAYDQLPFRKSFTFELEEMLKRWEGQVMPKLLEYSEHRVTAARAEIWSKWEDGGFSRVIELGPSNDS